MARDRVLFELTTPNRPLVSEEVDEVVIPGSLGYFGVLPGHAPFLTTVGIGEVSYRTGREERYLAVCGGFAEVGPEKVILLTETADLPQEIDRARADRARQRAEERLAGKSSDEIDYARALAALNRALTRLKVASRAQ
ncbi:MAG TPA: F0F1 ATP synthase subunit epsilon [Methylomirabilota bacterium]|nr:F0F1 ATP synthase subunit epsilon [Methylomirabilota bacterium]